MNTPTPTPRTDAAWNATFDGEQISAGKTARALRECSQQLETELTTLTTERDHWQKIAVSASREREHNANVAQAMTAERDQLRAQLHALQLVCGTTDADNNNKQTDEYICVDREHGLWKRKEPKEPNVNADRLALALSLQTIQDLEAENAALRTDNARLDWLLQDDVTRFDVSYHDRSAIDAAMKEGA